MLIDVLRRLRTSLAIPKVTEESGRNLDLDALRGLAILLVVLGHAITYTQPDYRAPVFTSVNLLAAFIYTFHVPLFCFVSGFVIFGKRVSVRDKFLRLALPFLAWIPVSYLVDCYAVRVHPGLKDMLHRAITGQLGLWYLWFLFLCCLTLVPVRWMERRSRWGGELTLAGFTLLFILLPLNVRGVLDLRNWFIFFALGYLTAKHRAYWEDLSSRGLVAPLRLAALSFPLVFILLYKKAFHFYYMNGIRDIFAHPYQFLGHLGLAVMGISAAGYLVMALRRGHIYRALCWFGLVSMDIYVAQAIMLKLARGEGWSLIGSAFAAGVFLSLALSFLLLRRSRLLGALFLGLEWERQETVGAWLRARWDPLQAALSRRLRGGVPGASGWLTPARDVFRRLSEQEQ